MYDVARYVQLPVNVGMPEAWRDAWQVLPAKVGAQEQMGTLLEAAGQLGVGVFASGPLQEGQLVQDGTLQVCAPLHVWELVAWLAHLNLAAPAFERTFASVLSH